MGNEKLTTLARRLRPFLSAQLAALISGGAVSEGPDIDLIATVGGTQVGRGGDTILLFDSGGNPVAESTADETGFNTIIASAASGDLIRLPNRTVTITTTKVIPAGVTLQGMSRRGSIIVYSGSYHRPIDIQGGTIENLTVNYTYSGTTTNAAAVYLYTGRARHLDITATSTTNTTGELAGIGGPCVEMDDIYAVVTAKRSAIGIQFTADTGIANFVIRDLFGVATSTDDSANYNTYGLYLDTPNAADRVSIYDCYGYATSKATGGSGKLTAGIHFSSTGVIQAWGCHGYSYGDTGGCDLAGIEYACNNTYETSCLFDCTGYAFGYDTQDCYGIINTYIGRIVGGYYEGSSYTDSFGAYFWTNSECEGATFRAVDNGGTFTDIKTDGTTSVYGCQYITTIGTIAYLRGDRAAYSVEDYHATDIESGTLTRHAPLATDYSDRFMVTNGTSWVAASPVVYEGEIITNDGDIVWLT